MDAIWKLGVTKMGFPYSVIFGTKKHGKQGIFSAQQDYKLLIIRKIQ
jgi:hypothetical protein